MLDIITNYIVGGKHFIQTTKDLFRKSRKSHRYELFKSEHDDLIEFGYDFKRQD